MVRYEVRYWTCIRDSAKQREAYGVKRLLHQRWTETSATYSRMVQSREWPVPLFCVCLYTIQHCPTSKGTPSMCVCVSARPTRDGQGSFDAVCRQCYYSLLFSNYYSRRLSLPVCPFLMLSASENGCFPMQIHTRTHTYAFRFQVLQCFFLRTSVQIGKKAILPLMQSSSNSHWQFEHRRVYQLANFHILLLCASLPLGAVLQVAAGHRFGFAN